VELKDLSIGDKVLVNGILSFNLPYSNLKDKEGKVVALNPYKAYPILLNIENRLIYALPYHINLL